MFFNYLKRLLLLCSLLPAYSGRAQQCLFSGNIADTVNFQNTQNTEVQFVGLTDTSLNAVTTADEEGRFRFRLKPGTYRIILRNPIFAIFEDTLTLAAGNRDVTFFMPLKTHLLHEVSIVNRPAMSRNGDTTEYIADSFAVMEFGTVEELLIKLPGLDQDENGHIMALGKRVTKIMVDGEAFFSSDPIVVARMLHATAIDKVQLFEEKEEQAVLSGIDKGGPRTRTLNLVLKENAKRGYFGKAKVSGGPPRYFDNYAALNAFEGKRKVAAYGSMNSTGSTAGRFYNGGNTNNEEVKGQQGIPRNNNGGLHYDNRWFNNALTLSGNYLYGKQETENSIHQATRYILPDSQYRSDRENQSFSGTEHHAINMDGRYVMDTSAYLKFNIAYTTTNGGINSSASSATSGADGQPVNAQTQSQQGSNRNHSFELGIFYGKHFRKAGRTFSAEVKASRRNSFSNMWMDSRTVFKDQSADSLSQRKEGNAQIRLINVAATYSDAISRGLYWELAYRLESSNSLSQQYSYDRLHGVYEGLEKLDARYSSNYQLGIITNHAETRLKLDLERWNIGAGFAVVNAGYTQKDFSGTRNYSYTTLSIAPELRIDYLGNEGSSGSLVYTGQAQPPVLDQVQPLVQNGDPLNVYEGNPDLRQEFRHQFAFNYNVFSSAQTSSVFVNVTYTLVQHAISMSQFTDQLGRSVFRYTNVDGNNAAGLSAGYSQSIKSLNLKAGIRLDASLSQMVMDINDQHNRSVEGNYSCGINLRYFSGTSLELSNVSSVNYNTNTNSVLQGSNNRFIYYRQQNSFIYKPASRIRLETSIQWLLRQKINAEDRQNSIANWNVSFAFSLLKNRSLRLSCSVQDLLNQNRGFSRMVSNNIIREQTFSTLKRYVLFGLSWDFNYYRRGRPK